MRPSVKCHGRNDGMRLARFMGWLGAEVFQAVVVPKSQRVR